MGESASSGDVTHANANATSPLNEPLSSSTQMSGNNADAIRTLTEDCALAPDCAKLHREDCIASDGIDQMICIPSGGGEKYKKAYLDYSEMISLGTPHVRCVFVKPKDVEWGDEDQAKFASWDYMDEDLWYDEIMVRVKKFKEHKEGGGGGGGCCTIA